MPRPWQEITEDQILNYDQANTAVVAQYDRIMSQRMRATLLQLNQGLSSALAQTNQRIHDESEKIIQSNLGIARGQERLQRYSFLLSGVIAMCTLAYVIITGFSVSAMREGNRIQGEILAYQRESKTLGAR